MKKTYTAPMFVPSGDVARETLGGLPNIGVETEFSKPGGAGAVGYYL